ncbi:MAG TPA: hypothetical protein VMX96_01395 [Dehalococcoidia bacterium]|nr:hypothetical protein [Dehalococcoidia bacterium]
MARFTGERSVIVEGWIGVSVGVGVGFSVGAVVAVGFVVGVGVRVISFSGHPVTASVTSAVKTGRKKRRASTRSEYEDA